MILELLVSQRVVQVGLTYECLFLQSYGVVLSAVAVVRGSIAHPGTVSVFLRQPPIVCFFNVFTKVGCDPYFTEDDK